MSETVALDEDAGDSYEQRDDERGQGMVEYAFILVLIALVLILAVTVLGGQTKNLYSNISSAVH